MASRRKANGKQSFLYVREAARMCNCTIEEFFARVPRTFSGGLKPREALAKFRDAERSGDLNYRIPGDILGFAQVVHMQPHPVAYFNQNATKG